MRHVRAIQVIAIVAALCAGGAPRAADAGLSDILSRATAWWQAKGIAATGIPGHGSRVTGHESDEGKKPADGEKPGGAANRAPGMCIVPQELPTTACEPGDGFLCVDTPPGGVAGDSFVLRGTLDRKGSVLAGMHIVVQHEYTKKSAAIDIDTAVAADCRGTLPEGKGSCLDAAGFFAVRVPLAAKGPHTISVSASRLSGESVEKRVRTSRVVPLVLDASRVSFEPDVRTVSDTDAAHVMVSVGLLGECQFCDFIGASTGGVRVTVDNTITDPSGTTHRISCPTTIEQGGQGVFLVGVPTGPGNNALTITACNAAAAAGSCPSVGGIAFSAKGGARTFEMVSPAPAPTYAAAQYPTIAWEFALGEGSGCVNMQFNREAPRELCPAANGRYLATLAPRIGINAATILTGEGVEEFAWTFGWGSIASPHANGGVIEVPGAVRAMLPASSVQGILKPFINNFLASDEMGALISRLFEKPAGDAQQPAAAASPKTDMGIPKCAAGGGLGKFHVALRGVPSMDDGAVDEIAFAKDRVDLKSVFHGLRLGIDLSPDKDGDGKGDREPVPLVIAFKKLIAEVSFEERKDEGGRPLLILGSPHDDCSFKDSDYCSGTPAVLVPQNFVGGATPWGGFISCDEHEAKGEAVEVCQAINSLNAQTGVLSEKILDAINGAIYCGGSAAATRLAREGVSIDGLRFGCAEGKACTGLLDQILPPVSLPFAAALRDGVDLSPAGLEVAASLSVGKQGLYDATPERFRIPEAGIVTGGDIGTTALGTASSIGADLSLALALDAINAFLFAATVQGDGHGKKGALDVDVDEDFFAKAGFDFVKQCDQFTPVPGVKESQSTVCYIRPRVGELLGSPLTTYGYFPTNQPLLLALRGNRALSPRLSVRTLDELPVVPRIKQDGEPAEGEGEAPSGHLLELEVAGLALSFYALEVDATKPADAYGNPAVKRDASGKPVIHSMRPGAADPFEGQIATFDLSLLLGIEIGSMGPSLKNPEQSVIPVRLLPDRSRLILVPLPGTNATTVPDVALTSALVEKLRLAIAGMGSREKPIEIPVPQEIALSAPGDESFFAAVGLRTIAFGPDGIAFDADPASNSLIIALQAVITQVLHEDGKEIVRTIPKR